MLDPDHHGKKCDNKKADIVLEQWLRDYIVAQQEEAERDRGTEREEGERERHWT